MNALLYQIIDAIMLWFIRKLIEFFTKFFSTVPCFISSTASSFPKLKVNKGDKLKVKWLDGSTYVGTVLSQEVAVACIRPDAYPKEYQIWITANDLAKDYQLKETGTSKNGENFILCP